MFSKKVKTIFNVEGMSCSHCANKVKNELEKISDIKKVEVDLSKKQVIILSKNILDENLIKQTIENLDYKYMGIIKE
jgi:Cu+-exporting ATPase